MSLSKPEIECECDTHECTNSSFKGRFQANKETHHVDFIDEAICECIKVVREMAKKARELFDNLET